MGSLIPYFYYDLIARIAPGALALFLSLLRLPEFRNNLFKYISEIPGQSFLVPIFYGGITYIIGLCLDVTFNQVITKFYKRGFVAAVCKCDFLTTVVKFPHADSNADRLSGQCYDWYMIKTAEHPNQQQHTIRFHGEAKFFFHSIMVLLIFLISFLKYVRFSFSHDCIFLFFVVLITTLYWCLCERAKRRAKQVLAYIDCEDKNVYEKLCEKIKGEEIVKEFNCLGKLYFWRKRK